MKAFVRAKTVQKQGIWTLLTLLTAACAVLVTVLFENLEERLHLNWDLTQNRIYSIGETTKSVLAGLDRDIVIYTVYPQGGEDRTVGELLRRYEASSHHIQSHG